MARNEDEWAATKNQFALRWREVFDEKPLAPLSEGGRTRTMIGDRTRRRCGDPGGQVQQVLSRLYTNEPDAWFVPQVFSVDLAVLILPGFASARDPELPWKESYATGTWRTLAFVEHENAAGLKGLVPSVRKLLDYRDDVLRVAIGYANEPERDAQAEVWGHMLRTAVSQSSASMVLVIGKRQAGRVSWHLLHFVDSSLEVLVGGTN